MLTFHFFCWKMCWIEHYRQHIVYHFGQKFFSKIISISKIRVRINLIQYTIILPILYWKITSRSHVRKSSSMRKSYPNSSKQFFLRFGFKLFFTLRNVSIIKSFILGTRCFSTLIPYSEYFSSKYFCNLSRPSVLPSSCFP